MEITLVKAFGWSLKDIDDTDLDSLIPFVLRLSGADARPARAVFCDEVTFL